MAQGQGSIVIGSVIEPTVLKAPTPLAVGADPAQITTHAAAIEAQNWAISDCNEWRRLNGMAIGNINLHLTPLIQQNFHSHDNAADLWAALRAAYGKATVPSIYKDFKEVISIRFNPNQHPSAQFDKLAAAFGCLALVTVGTAPNQTSLMVQNQLQAMIALAALPQTWENQISIITQNVELHDLDLNDVWDTIVAQYETETNRGQHKAPHNANKILAVKHKRNNPDFNKQENQQQHQSSGSSSKPSGNQQQLR